MKPVAVIGAGLLGRGIAAVAARSGFPVILHDSNPTALAAALEFVRVESGSSGDQVVAEASLARAVDGVEFVIESVIEDLLVKRQVFFQLGEVNADAILMSNSSVLPISQIAVLTRRPECSAEDVDRIASASLGASLAERGPIAEMHALGLPRVVQELKAILPLINSDPHPAPLLRDKVAENQLGAKTGQGFLAWPAGQRERATVRLRSHLLRRLGGLQTASGSTSLSDGDWKIARRLRAAVWREALGMLENNVCSPETIDVMATKTLGLRLAVMGPVENADYVGLDLALAIHEALLPCLDVALGVPMKLKRAVEMGEPL
jgi:3-hydroxybutyryl-CoA dehydrogenase